MENISLYISMVDTLLHHVYTTISIPNWFQHKHAIKYLWTNVILDTPKPFPLKIPLQSCSIETSWSIKFIQQVSKIEILLSNLFWLNNDHVWWFFREFGLNPHVSFLQILSGGSIVIRKILEACSSYLYDFFIYSIYGLLKIWLLWGGGLLI